MTRNDTVERLLLLSSLYQGTHVYQVKKLKLTRVSPNKLSAVSLPAKRRPYRKESCSHRKSTMTWLNLGKVEEQNLLGWYQPITADPQFQTGCELQSAQNRPVGPSTKPRPPPILVISCFGKHSTSHFITGSSHLTSARTAWHCWYSVILVRLCRRLGWPKTRRGTQNKLNNA